MAGPALALAQEAPTQKVEVTGSRIPRLAVESALPVQIITRDEIARSGAQDLEELFERVTAALGGWRESASVSTDERAGYSGVALHGLGTKSTLVLLNGRRLVNHAFSSSGDTGVDLHMIPLAALDRVEVLKDGASALYGSEAVGGVVNFILRTDYSGIEGNASRGIAERGGAASRRAVASLGLGTLDRDGWHLFATLSHRRVEAMKGAERDFAATAYRPEQGLNQLSQASFPANIPAGPGRLLNPAAPNCPARHVLQRGTACFFDFAPTVDLVSPLEHSNLVASAAWKLGEAHQARIEWVASSHRLTSRSSPSPVFAVANAENLPIVLPTTSPYYPVGLGLSGDLVNLRYRPLELGVRGGAADTDQQRVLAALRGSAGAWTYDGALSSSRSRATLHYVDGYVAARTLIDGIAAGLINPFGPSGPAGQQALAGAALRGLARVATSRAGQADLRGNTELAQWRNGAVSLALGGEWRNETLDDLTTDLTEAVSGGSYRAPKNGTRRSASAFAELLLPLAKGLELQWALRNDHYSDFGTTLNPKLGLRWQPTREWLVRASAGTGFRAPSLPELYTQQTTGFISEDTERADPLRCPVTRRSEDCTVATRTVSGGNPELKPERSRQASIGVGFAPVPGLTMTVDHWRLTLVDTIAALSDVTFGDPIYEGRNIVRGPPDPAYPSLPGPIERVVLINENLGRSATSGWDLALRWQGAATRWGRWHARLEGTHLDRATVVTGDGRTQLSVLGAQPAGLPAVPRWMRQSGIGGRWAGFSAELSHHYRSGYRGPDNDASGARRVVDAYERFDLNVSAELPRGVWGELQLALGVRNLKDSDPPFVSSGSFQIGYDPAYADARGRYWTLGVSWRPRGTRH